ncbi:hypothetical protein SteCoe_20561 [Stentor coeruleus]|uniref:Uncharacterized protein n=1 Tax=Stentor coeruleus TaxID=5963 RepID=A0A1R2BRY3_9CILI|nr:hypothetical protein SteCoe_20561 [Stentor coeruleus]
MNINLCFYPQCLNSPEFICFCSDKETIFCEDHLSLHISEGYNHKIKKNFGNRKIFITQCKLSLSKLKSIRDNINKKVNDCIKKIIEQAKFNFEYLRRKELLIMKVIEALKIKKKFCNNQDERECEKFIIKYSRSPENICQKLQEKEVAFIENLDIGCMKNDLELKIKGLKEEISELRDNFRGINNEIFNITKITEESQKRFEDHEINLKKNYDNLLDTQSYLGLNYEDECIENSNDTKIWYFQYNTMTMVTVNVTAQVDSAYIFNLPQKLSSNASYCKISKNKFFYYSGYNEKVYLDSTYIFDAENKTYEKKASWKLNQLAACSLYKRNIYVFGGCNNKLHGESGKYNLVSDTWNEIASLPAVSHHNLSLVIDKHIIISGFHLSSAFKYNIKNNNYIYVGSFTPNCHKIVCKGKGKVFIFENNKLHESTTKDCTNFVLLKSAVGLPDKFIQSYTIRNEDYLYFILGDMNLYRFNLNSKVVSIVRNIHVV